MRLIYSPPHRQERVAVFSAPRPTRTRERQRNATKKTSPATCRQKESGHAKRTRSHKPHAAKWNFKPLAFPNQVSAEAIINRRELQRRQVQNSTPPSLTCLTSRQNNKKLPQAGPNHTHKASHQLATRRSLLRACYLQEGGQENLKVGHLRSNINV